MRNVDPETDFELARAVSAAREGYPEAWERLFRRYQLPLFAYAMDLLRDEQASLDVVQETFARAARHLDGLRADARFGSWLFGIAHQRVVQCWRCRGGSPGAEEAAEAAEPLDEQEPWTELVRQEDRALVLAAIDTLPLAQRSVVLLHFLEDFSLAEIAEVLETSVGTIKSRLHYARRALRHHLASAFR
jgi:RNA polymerase sigma-70 factor (ECF subfamily)